jgi:hypothetical protein
MIEISNLLFVCHAFLIMLTSLKTSPGHTVAELNITLRTKKDN